MIPEQMVEQVPALFKVEELDPIQDDLRRLTFNDDIAHLGILKENAKLGNRRRPQAGFSGETVVFFQRQLNKLVDLSPHHSLHFFDNTLFLYLHTALFPLLIAKLAPTAKPRFVSDSRIGKLCFQLFLQALTSIFIATLSRFYYRVSEKKRQETKQGILRTVPSDFKLKAKIIYVTLQSIGFSFLSYLPGGVGNGSKLASRTLIPND